MSETKFSTNFDTNYQFNQFVCKLDSKQEMNAVLKVSYEKVEYITNQIDLIIKDDLTVNNLKLKFNELRNNNNNFKNYLVILCEDLKNEICEKAYNLHFISKRGGTVKLKINNDNIFYYHLNGLPCLINNVNIDRNDKNVNVLKEKFKIFKTENLNQLLLIAQTNNNNNNRNFRNKLSSFLQVNNENTKFYSNDMLMKLEKGLNTVTNKVIEESKRINEAER